MQIGKLSELTGFSKDTIRWYEKIGLIQLDKKARYENNYRKYDQSAVEKLLQIKKIKSYGFTLNEIKEMLLLESHDELTCNSVTGIFDKRLKEIEEQIAKLQLIRSKLLQLQKECVGDCVENFKATKN